MLSFWVVLVAMALLAASFLFLPAWRQGRNGGPEPVAVNRDEQVLDLFNEHQQDLQRQLDEGTITAAQGEQLKSELELTLLEDMSVAGEQRSGMAKPWLLWVAGLLVPVAALVLYQQRGSQADLEIVAFQHDKYRQDMMVNHEGSSPNPAAAIKLRDALSDRLQARPDNLQNRYLLARVAVELEEYQLAVEHYGYILSQDPKAVKVIAEMAQVVFLAADNRITPEVSQLVDRALEINPADATALGLKGIEAYQEDDLLAAADHWNKALAAMDPASGAAQSLRAGVRQVQTLLAERGVALPQTDTGEQQVTELGQSSISVAVSLAASAQVKPEQVVYIYARAWQGAPVPLAIQRVSVADLPLTITLDESMAMAPGMTITSFDQLELIARVSRDGGPRSQSGDWQASQGPLELATLKGVVKLVIADQIQ